MYQVPKYEYPFITVFFICFGVYTADTFHFCPFVRFENIAGDKALPFVRFFRLRRADRSRLRRRGISVIVASSIVLTPFAICATGKFHRCLYL